MVNLAPGSAPAVTLHAAGAAPETLSAQFVIAVDGRMSRVRGWAGFAVNRDPERLVVAGLLLAGARLPGDAVRVVSRAALGQLALFFPLRDGRHPAYFAYHRTVAPRPLSGQRQVPAFLAACVEAGADPAWFADAEAVGPLAAFEGADSWVDHPYRAGVALVGDAAAACDPSWGCGLSLTLRDARTLRDLLLAGDDWDAAGHAYAAAHDRYYAALHRLEHWRTALVEIGPEADARRARVLPRLAATPPGGAPDLVGLGPDGPSDVATLRTFS